MFCITCYLLRMIETLLNCKCVFSKGQHPVDVKLGFSFSFLYHTHKILRVMNVMDTFIKFLLVFVSFFFSGKRLKFCSCSV